MYLMFTLSLSFIRRAQQLSVHSSTRSRLLRAVITFHPINYSIFIKSAYASITIFNMQRSHQFSTMIQVQIQNNCRTIFLFFNYSRTFSTSYFFRQLLLFFCLAQRNLHHLSYARCDYGQKTTATSNANLNIMAPSQLASQQRVGASNHLAQANIRSYSLRHACNQSLCIAINASLLLAND